MKLASKRLAVLSVLLLLTIADEARAQPGLSTSSYSLADRGALSQVTPGSSANVGVGYAAIQPSVGNAVATGVAIFGFRQNNTLISEAGVPASPLISSGRIYAEIGGGVDTGIAIANPNNQTAHLTFYFTDSLGNTALSGTTTIVPNGQIATFLDQAPFGGGAAFNGTFTFTSDVTVGAVALKGFTNERSEFLLSTLPVISIPSAATGSVYFPDFADGGGWSTQVILVNPTDSPVSGTVQFFGQGSLTATAQAVTMTINGQTAAAFPYTIPGRSSIRLQTSGTAAVTSVGSVHVTPSANNVVPGGQVGFSFKNAGITVAQAAVPAATPQQALRMYAEASNIPTGAIETGIAIANPASAAAPVTFELTTPAGVSTGLTGTATVPGNGQISLFLNQISGFETLLMPFQGVLRISTTSANGVAVTGIRGRYNERGDFLLTTTPPVSEAAAPSSSVLLFPHLADGGGYTTQFILLNNSVGKTVSGSLRFVMQNGFSLVLQLNGSSAIQSSVNPFVSTIVVSRDGEAIPAGKSVQLFATRYDASGTRILADPYVWSSNNPQVLSVSSTGLVTPIGAGTATIQATVHGLAGTATLTVGGPTAPYTFTEAGQILGAADIGFTPGQNAGTADASGIELPDKRIRVYFGLFDGSSGPGKIGSAISTDGIHFTVEPGLREPADATPLEGFASPFIYALPGGGYRLFYNGCHPGGCGISSSTSVDGLNFTGDAGLRFQSPIAGDQPACAGILRLKTGGYRIFCSALLLNLAPPISAIFSAVSYDLLNWSVEPGFRIGAGAPHITDDANHPSVIQNADGTASLIYYQRIPGASNVTREMIATSSDGFSFVTQIDTGVTGTEPSWVQRADGSVILYHGDYLPAVGSIILVTNVAVHP